MGRIKDGKGGRKWNMEVKHEEEEFKHSNMILSQEMFSLFRIIGQLLIII